MTIIKMAITISSSAQDDEQNELQIPLKLLEAAKIEESEILQITCIDGAILLSRATPKGYIGELCEYYEMVGGEFGE